MSAALMAGMGIKLWLFVQDLAILQDNYRTWQTFFSNAGIIQAFSVGGIEEAEIFSKMLGEEEVEMVTEGQAGLQTSSSSGFRPRLSATEIIERYERGTYRQLLFVRGLGPLELWRGLYFKDPDFLEWDPLPEHRGPRAKKAWDRWSRIYDKRKLPTAVLPVVETGKWRKPKFDDADVYIAAGSVAFGGLVFLGFLRYIVHSKSLTKDATAIWQWVSGWWETLWRWLSSFW